MTPIMEVLGGTENRLFVEPWDHTTVRLIWAFDEKVAFALADDEVVPEDGARLAVTRSLSGTPVTPLDGTRIFLSEVGTNPAYNVPILNSTGEFFSSDGGGVIDFPVDVAPEQRTDSSVRPYGDIASVYDRNLVSGRVYYYTVFLYLPSGDPDGELVDGERWSWVPLASASCRLAGAFDHHRKLFNLIPPYYQALDQEYLAGTGRDEGDLERFVKVIGLHFDKVRADAENIQDIHNVDKTDERLLRLLGEGNLGYAYEAGLGGIRYRSIMGNLARITNARGSLRGVARLSRRASQYDTAVVGTANIMRRVSDSDFSRDTGSWTLVDGPGTLRAVTDPAEVVEGFPTLAGTYAEVVLPAGTATTSLYCGEGQHTTTATRFHRPEVSQLDPLVAGIPAELETSYTFSFYLRNVSDASGTVTVGMTAVLRSPTGTLIGVANRSEVCAPQPAPDRKVVQGLNDRSSRPIRVATTQSFYLEDFLLQEGVTSEDLLGVRVLLVPFIHFTPASTRPETRQFSACMVTAVKPLADSYAPSTRAGG